MTTELSHLYPNFSNADLALLKNVLDFLEIELPKYKKLEATNQRLADETTVAWIEKFNKCLLNHAT